MVNMPTESQNRNRVPATAALALAAVAVLVILGSLLTISAQGAAPSVSARDGVLTVTAGIDQASDLRVRTSDRAGTCGFDDGRAGPCLLVEDVEGRPASSDACQKRPSDHFSLVCDLKAVDRVVIANTADLPMEAAFAAPSDASGTTCSPVPVTVSQPAGNGATNTDDGCAQTIDCGAGYSGAVRADTFDTISKGCTAVTVNGNTVRSTGMGACTSACPGPGGGGSTTPPSTPGPTSQAPPPGAIEAARGVKAISGATLRRRSGRGFALTVEMKQAARYTVDLQRRTNGRFRRVRAVSRSGRVGRNTVMLTRAATGKLRPGTYRAVITAAGTAQVVRSSRVTLSR